MYPTIIIENFIEKNKIDLIQSSLYDLKFELNPSAKEETYSTLRSYSVNIDFVHYNIIEQIDKKIEECIGNHYNRFVDSYVGRSIVRYMERQYIDFHKDWEPTDEWVVINKKNTVHLSSVFYLNDDYYGGDLIFYNDQKEKYFSIKPKKNSVILFDALQLHATAPIISGIKYSYTNFYTLKES